MKSSTLKPWKTLSRRIILEHSSFLTVESHTVQLPDGQVISDWPWIITPDAAIVLAATPDHRFICFSQTKYAIEGTSLAPVGGMLRTDELPIDAAKRELLEETGYESSNWVNLGSYRVGPNRGIAMMHLFLALDAEQVAKPNSDDLEDQHLLYLNKPEIEAALEAGEFKVLAWTAVVALALHHVYRREEGT